MTDIISNARVNPIAENKDYEPLIEKLCGLYPLKKRRFDKHILLDKKPEEGLDVINAYVTDCEINMQFLLGIKPTPIKRRFWSKEEKGKELYKTDKAKGYAFVGKNYPELGITRGELLYLDTKRNFLTPEERTDLGRLLSGSIELDVKNLKEI